MVFAWIGFVLLVLIFLALDLGVFHRKAHVVKVKEALVWSGIWITIALLFTVFIYFGYENHWLDLGKSPDGIAVLDAMSVSSSNPRGELDGASASIKYLTGYVIEKSLSVDNIFVIAMIFGFLAVPAIYQHRVLFWGILGALLMRGVMIWLGAGLIHRYHWVIYIFGGFLILTGIKMLLMKEHEKDPSNNIIVRATKKLFPVTSNFHGQHFFVRAGSRQSHEASVPGQPEKNDAAVEALKAGTLMITPLFVALVLIEFTDLIFAVDSIPAIFAITTDPFLVFTSNVFAILGLRSLYFALAGMMDKFRYLKPALACVLLLVGVKMLAHQPLRSLLGEHFNLYMLGAVLLILAIGVVASLASKREPARAEEPAPVGP
ncbi:MAG TPA: TerC family protein [Tepidisphaeraceae bacterium]|jgi:tellurite resistance protein TerC|nr:TerC family protein [Tepidisphaeraceae bacterium]